MTTRRSAHHKLTDGPGIRTVGDQELRTVRGGRSWIGRAWDWAKKHVVATLHSIGYKGTF